jgi:hypothetical protein
MKDIYQILRQKEMDIIRLRTEADALRFAIPLLEEGAASMDGATVPHQLPHGDINLWPLRVEVPSQDSLPQPRVPTVEEKEPSFQL